MICINSPADYKKLLHPSVHPLARRYLIQYVDQFLKEYALPDLSEIGPVFFMQSEADMCHYQAVGLSQPLDQALNEFSQMLVLKGGGQVYKLILSVYIFSNSYGISLFLPHDLTSDHIKMHIFEELYDTKEVNYDMEDIT